MSIIDEFKYKSSDRDDPVENAAEVTPNDSTDLTNVTRGIYIGTSGDVEATFVNGTTVTLVGLAGGLVYPFRLSRILATGTTATNIVALW